MDNDLKVIFLDAGGVLFETFIKSDDRIRNILLGRGYELEKINGVILKAKAIERNFISNWEEEVEYFKTYYGAIAEELNDPQLSDGLFLLAHYANHCELFPEVTKVLEQLSKHYRLAVISNALPSMEWVFDKLDLRKHFETIVMSAYVNEEKPSPGIYGYALKQVDALPEDCLFIDDKIENVEAAGLVGITGLHLDRNRCNLAELLQEAEIHKSIIKVP